MSEEKDDNFKQQLEEIEALSSIYLDAITIRSYSGLNCCDISFDDVTLSVTMPVDYPKEAPPTYEISAPFLRGIEKQQLYNKLEEIYAENFIGEPGVIFAWAECAREFVENWNSERVHKEPEANLPKDLELPELKVSPNGHCPVIVTGECIEDRKSIFQPHYAKVTSQDEVKMVINKLLENRKIAHATHNMYAYRIKKDGKGGGILQDCDDDGETHAGSRMLHLLEILNVENVLVVVSRWFGGIQLGADRFKHINNATRAVLEFSGVVLKKETTAKKKGNKK